MTSPKVKFRLRLVKALLISVPVIFLLWAGVCARLDAPRYDADITSVDIRYLGNFFLNQDTMPLAVSVFSFSASNWKKFELDVYVTRAGIRRSVTFPEQDSVYSWWRGYWKARFFVVATQEGSVALSSYDPRITGFGKLNYLSPFSDDDEEWVSAPHFSWMISGGNHYQYKNSLFHPDVRMQITPNAFRGVIYGSNRQFDSDLEQISYLTIYVGGNAANSNLPGESEPQFLDGEK